MKTILIAAGSVEMQAELNDSPTAQQIWEALLPAAPRRRGEASGPDASSGIEGRANTWGDEIYFEIPIVAGQEADARAQVEVGELGYWPPGHAFCIFFGPTPASTGSQPRAASPVNILGKVVGDATAFRAVRSGATVRLSRVTES